MRQFFVRKENAFGECGICPCQLILLFAHSGKFFNRSYSLDIYLPPPPPWPSDNDTPGDLTYGCLMGGRGGGGGGRPKPFEGGAD